MSMEVINNSQQQSIYKRRRSTTGSDFNFARRPSQTHSLLLHRINSWLTEPISIEQLERYLQCVRKLQDLNNFHASDLTIPVLILCNRFVIRQGLLSKDKFFLLLLVSVGIAIKAFEEEGTKWVNMSSTSAAIGISIKDLCRLEKELLISIEWTCYISGEEYARFADETDYNTIAVRKMF